MAQRSREMEQIEAMPTTVSLQEGPLQFTALLSIIIALVLGYLAWRGKQYWLVSWCVGLMVAALAYLYYASR